MKAIKLTEKTMEFLSFI